MIKDSIIPEGQANNERWLPVIGYEDMYEVSNAGHVRSIERTVSSKEYGSYRKKGRVMRLQISDCGYLCVHLCKNGTEKRFRVHTLVIEAFISKKPFTKAQVNHKDGIKTNNHPDNLEWCTNSENQKHAIRLGLSNPRIAEYMKGRIPWNKNHRKYCVECKEPKKMFAKDRCSACYYRQRDKKKQDSRALYLAYQTLYAKS